MTAKQKSKAKAKSRPAARARSASSAGADAKPKPPTTILLIRHGETATTGKVLPGRAKGLELSAKGIEQAQATAQAVSQQHQLAAIYASPMKRARQTADPLARLAKHPVKVHAGLNECDFGSWTGKNLSALRKLPAWQQVQHNPSNFRFPKGESFPEMQNRMMAALAELAQRHRGKTIAAYSHADTIKAAVAQALGVHLDLFQRIIISPASITTIQLSADGPYVLGMNHNPC